MKGVRLSGVFEEARILPREVALAISIGGSTHAVMMASPDDLIDFAYGFLLADGVIAKASEIDNVTIVVTSLGIDLQIRLIDPESYRAQKRAMVGPVGCGLCGVESLELAVPNLARVTFQSIPATLPFEAVSALSKAQNQRQKSGALHAACLYHNGEALFVREDIGRHNALDKSIGAAIREGVLLPINQPHSDQHLSDLTEGTKKQTLAQSPSTKHVLTQTDVTAVISSRISLDLVIKAVRAGIGTLIGRASPSDLAVTYAEKWGLKLIAPVFETEYFISGEPS